MEKECGIVDMTKGNPVRHILVFAVPLFIGKIFQQIYNIVDTTAAGYNLKVVPVISADSNWLEKWRQVFSAVSIPLLRRKR